MKRWLRLRRPQDFARARAEGRVFRHPLLIVNTVPNGLEHNRYGFVTARRLGNAVTRNRARRQMGEAVRRFHPALNPGNDIIFIARAPIVSQSYAAISDALETTLRRAGLVMDEHKDS